MRYFWLASGHISLIIGVIGIFVPLLPTTPFLLLASYCYARGSSRFEAWLLNHPRLGPPVRDWRDKGVIPLKVKVIALCTIASSAAYVSSLSHIPLIGKLAMGLTLGGVSLFIATRPSV